MSSYPNATEIPEVLDDPNAHYYLLETATPEVAQRFVLPGTNVYLVHRDFSGDRNVIALVYGDNPRIAAIAWRKATDHVIKWRGSRGETGPETVTIASFLAEAGN